MATKCYLSVWYYAKNFLQDAVYWFMMEFEGRALWPFNDWSSSSLECHNLLSLIEIIFHVEDFVYGTTVSALMLAGVVSHREIIGIGVWKIKIYFHQSERGERLGMLFSEFQPLIALRIPFFRLHYQSGTRGIHSFKKFTGLTRPRVQNAHREKMPPVYHMLSKCGNPIFNLRLPLGEEIWT